MGKRLLLKQFFDIIIKVKIKNLPNKLPVSIRPFFWDTDSKKLDPSKFPLYVINRLLDKGDLEAVRWVKRNFSEKLIIKTIKTRRDFSFKTVIFWSRIYKIPFKEIKCMQEPYRAMRKMHWLN